MQPVTVLDIVTNALYKLGKFSPIEAIPSEDSAYALTELQGMLDGWDAQELFIFATDYLQFILVPGVQPLLIGQGSVVTAVACAGGVATYTAKNSYSTGDSICTGSIGTVGGVQFNQTDVLVTSATQKQFTTSIGAGTVVTTAVVGQAIYTTPDDIFPNYLTVNQRPAKIADANIIINNISPIVKVPLRIRDKDWWIANSVPNITSSIPTDLYYNPKWPNGEIYLWPQQSVNYGLELEVWVNLAGVTDLTYQFYLPQGYWRAVTLSLAEALIPTYGLPLQRAAGLAKQAMEARAIIRNLNSKSPTILTRDPGIPRGGRSQNYFNWLNGTSVPPR